MYKTQSISMVENGYKNRKLSLLAIQNAVYYFSTQCWITNVKQGPSLLLESDRALQKCSLKYSKESKESTISSELQSLELGQWRRYKPQRFVGMCVWNVFLFLHTLFFAFFVAVCLSEHQYHIDDRNYSEIAGNFF